MNFIEFLENHYGVKSKLPDRYGDWLGYEIHHVDVDEQTVITKLLVRNDHLSPSGAVHGGVISGFLDFSCGCAVFSTLEKNQLCSTVDLNVKYFKPLRSGEEILAKAKIMHRGNTLCSVMAEVFKSENEKIPVALATATFNIYQMRQ